MTNQIIQGGCIEVMKTLPDNSVDAIVTDPPYELGFMGKGWDATGIANNILMWKEALRVLKPGGYLLSFGGTRTYHRMASAIEDAGFEIRDCIEWVYGSGFPKSLNIGKAVDKLQGNERVVIGKEKGAGITGDNQVGNQTFVAKTQYEDGTHDITKGTSEWEGWGTALKPSHEPIVMARKPLAEKTVAENVLKYGTGGINIDGCRVVATKEDMGDWDRFKGHQNSNTIRKNMVDNKTEDFKDRVDNGINTAGRFPANLIHDGSEEVLKEFEKAGISKSSNAIRYNNNDNKDYTCYGNYKDYNSIGHNDSGTPARFFKICEFTEEDFDYSPFFYCAKAGKSERNAGCEELEEKPAPYDPETGNGQGLRIGRYDEVNPRRILPTKNHHPTVKPVKLMEYLIKLVTPKGGIVLEPFAGSGTTCVACAKTGYKFIGIEKEPEYIKICEARIKPYLQQTKLDILKHD